MLFTLSLCLVFGMEAIWQTGESEIYQPLDVSEVVIGPEGKTVYILDFREARILMFKEGVEEPTIIGGKGRGPGEFTYPNIFMRHDNQLYVLDILDGQISTFDLDGTFLNRVKAPERDPQLARAGDSWVHGNWAGFQMDPDGNAKLLLSDHHFKKTTTIIDNLKRGSGSGGMVMESDGNVKAQFSPIDTYPKMLFDQESIFLTHPIEAKIYHFDIATKKLMTALTFEHKPIPFDTEWGDEKLADRLERRPKQRNYKWDKIYPEFFPAIRNILFDPDGNLVVDRWRGRPDDHHYEITLTRKGNVIDTKYPWETLTRFAGKVGNYAFVLTFDPEEEQGGVAKIPLASLEQFIKDNPIEFDGSPGRSVNISL